MWPRVLEAAGDRADTLEFVTNIFAIGDDLPPYAEHFIGSDMESLIAADSLAILRGDADQMVAELERRRDQTRVSYVLVPAQSMDQFAPVVERLSGR